MFKFIIQLLVVSSIVSLSVGETLNKFYVNETILEKIVDFPCPNRADIAPCVCIYESNLDRLTLDCTDITSNEELESILAKDFPVNDFYMFKMNSSDSLVALNFACGGVKFRRFYLYPGPYTLLEVTNAFYYSCSNIDLEHIQFWNTQLTSSAFPPAPFSDKITFFLQGYCNLGSVPQISSDSLYYLNFENAEISQITPGVLDEIPNLAFLYLHNNILKVLKSGAIPITYNGNTYYFPSNKLKTIEAGAFALKGEPPLDSLYIELSNNLLPTIDVSVFGLLMPYINDLRIDDNPLECDCDLAWIILNSANMAKVTRNGATPKCADGTLLTDLDPAPFEYYC